MSVSEPVSRRTFLATASALPFAVTALAQPQRRTVPVGLELYSVRGELGAPFSNNPNALGLTATVTAVAKMGYQVVEFYSPYMQWTVEQAKAVRKLMDDLGIKCPSTHNSLANISGDNLKKAIELNQILGSTAIIVASAPRITEIAGWKTVAAQLTAGAEALRPHGMFTGFHNHAVEWRPLEGQRPMDVLAASTPKDVIMQFDVGTCVEESADPVAWIKANPGRIRSTHLKDWGKVGGFSVAFGEGDVPWIPVLNAAETVGGAEYHLVEQEVAGAIGQIAMAQKCMDNYKKLRA